MTTAAERQRVRDRAADSQATHHEVIIRRTEWWPSPVSEPANEPPYAPNATHPR